MTQSLDQFFDSTDDSALISAVFEAICRHYGDSIDVSKIFPEERVVYLVEGAVGAIGSGGFNCLFETSLTGDPRFALTADTFETLGCAPATEAFRRALTLFPASHPPADLGERLRLYRHGSGENRHAIDKQFWAAGDEIDRCLANYVRQHRDAFAHLGRRSKPPTVKRRPKPVPEPPTHNDFDLDRLPHWARVAFAVRCARYVQPMFDKLWPDALPKRPAAVRRAIELAERSAVYGQPADGLDDAVRHAIGSAGAAIMAMYGMPQQEPVPVDGNNATTASFVAKVAEHAAEAARAAPDKSAEAAWGAFGFTKSVLESTDRMDEINGLLEDYATLRQAARRGRWTDLTPVPPDIFERSENGEMKKPWWKFW